MNIIRDKINLEHIQNNDKRKHTFTRNLLPMRNKKPFLILLISILVISFLGAQPIYNISGTLSGANEVPPNMSTATGTVSGTYNETTGMINLIYSFSGLSMASTAAHIHTAAIGVNGPIIVTLNHPAATSGSNNSTYPLLMVEEAGFLAGNTYVNIHNASFPAGEIRAQLSVVPARAIPTLSQWGFATLFLLLSIVGVVAVRKGMWNISTN